MKPQTKKLIEREGLIFQSLRLLLGQPVEIWQAIASDTEKVEKLLLAAYLQVKSSANILRDSQHSVVHQRHAEAFLFADKEKVEKFLLAAIYK